MTTPQPEQMSWFGPALAAIIRSSASLAVQIELVALFNFAFILPLLVVLYPPTQTALLNRALRLVRRPPLEHALSTRGVLTGLAWGGVSWLLLGMHIWLLARDLCNYEYMELPFLLLEEDEERLFAEPAALLRGDL